MKTALFVAILLIAISVPTAYASTLQLVTENGNVFSIDYDEILATWELYHGNSTAQIALNGTVQREIDNLQMQINDLITELNSNSTDTEIDKLEERVDDLLTQLNSNSTSTETEIERLGDLIANLTSNSDVAIDRLEQLIANLDNATESEITELNELLDELETDLLTQIDDLEAGTGVGAGALGSSGRLVSIPTEGILVPGAHIVYDTRGTIETPIAYFYPEYDFDWITMIRETEVYDEYAVPRLGAEYSVNSGTQTLRETISLPQSVELNVNGLRPNTAWALMLNGTDDASYAGVTNSAGHALIPRTPNDDVTITRGASFESSPNLEILDFSTVKDVISIDDWGAINDMHVIVTKIGSFSAVLVSPTGDLYPLLNGRSVTGSDSVEYIVDTTGEEMHGDWTLRFTSPYHSGATLLNWSMSINHGGDYSMIKSVSGSGKQYNVVVSPISSYGTHNLDLMNITGIGSYRPTGVYPLDRALNSGPDETHAVGGAELCPGNDLYVCSVENYNRRTWYGFSHPLQFLVTFNKPVVNVDTSDFNILYCSVYSTCDPYIITQNTALDVWHNSEQSTPNTSSIYQSRPTVYPSAKLIINASSPNDTNVDHWKLNLTAPNGHTIVITDGSTTRLDYDGGIHEFYLGEFADVNTGSGNWVLSVIDETYDDDPTTYYGNEPEGQINSWSIVHDVDTSKSRLTISGVTPEGTKGDQYLIDINRGFNGGIGAFTLWLDHTNNIESTSGETLNPRKEFGSNHHSAFHYVSNQPSALTSILVTNSTYDSVTFQVGFGPSVVGVNKTDFVVLENGVPDYSGPQVSTYTSAPNISVSRHPTDYGTYDTILVNNQREGVVNNMTLNVNISHPRISNLEVELVGPDGTIQMIHNNAGGNTVDLASSFTPNFASKEINGNWTLQIHDNVSLNTIGTLNSWSLDFSYEEPPTFDELTILERDKGETYTWKDFLPGNYNLRIYPDAAVHLTSCITNGIMIDVYNANSACIFNDKDETLIYKVSAYMRYPVTVDVDLRDIRMTEPGKSDVILGYLDNFYPAGSVVFIPVIPGMQTLEMKIEGSDTVVRFADIAVPVNILSIPSASGNPATSTTSMFSTSEGDVTAFVQLSTSRGGNQEYRFDFTDRYNSLATSSNDWSYSGSNPPLDQNPVTLSKMQQLILSNADNNWAAIVEDSVSVSASNTLYVDIDVYRNGDLVLSESVSTSQNANSLNVQAFGPFRGSISVSSSNNIETISERLSFYAEVGDYIEISITSRSSANSNIGYPPSTPPGGAILCREYNSGSETNGYIVSRSCDPGDIYITSTSAVFRDDPAPAVFTSSGSVRNEIGSGYIIVVN